MRTDANVCGRVRTSARHLGFQAPVSPTVANCRHWSPMIANGRQWSPLVAAGRQWFGGRSTSPAPYQRTARRPHATVRPRIPQRHHIRLIGSYVGQPVRKKVQLWPVSISGRSPALHPRTPAFKVERKANVECECSASSTRSMSAPYNIVGGGFGGGSMDWEGEDSCRPEGVGMGDMGRS